MPRLVRVSLLRKMWRHSWWLRLTTAWLLALVIFGLGIAVGSGWVQANISAVHSDNPGLPSQLDYSSVNQVYNTLRQNYDGKLTVAQLMTGLKQGLAESTNDPYTEYFDPTAAKAFGQELNNSFSGIGAELGKDEQGDLIVIAPIKGFPADLAGMRPQDIIVSVDGVSTSNLSPDIAASKIRGPAGTVVKLKVLRAKTENLTFSITRANIQLPSVTTKTLDGNIGYMQIRSFSDDTAKLAEQAAQQFKQSNVRGVILDLRGDPGGMLDAAISVSSLWLPSDKTIVSEKGTVGDQSYNSNGNDTLVGVPTVVLIDDGSASASEITAGALHDNGAARLIGTQSFGKGVVQQLIQFGDGSELKVTIASWYRPNGQNINKKGIMPDQTVTMSDADIQAHNDTQLQAAQAYLHAL